MKNSSYYIAPVGDRIHDLPHTVASNMVKVSYTLAHSATAAVMLLQVTLVRWLWNMLLLTALGECVFAFGEGLVVYSSWTKGLYLVNLLCAKKLRKGDNVH